MRKVDTVLFDFDGTIMDTTQVIVNSWQHTFKVLEGEERPVSDIYPTFGEPLAITMKRFFPNNPVDDSIEIYRSYQVQHFADLIEVFPGMIELLDELKKDGYVIALVTSRLRGTTNQGLDAFDLGKYFDTILTCDDTDKHKPDPTPINMTLDRLGKKPDNAIMIGDTKFDIECARNAGVKSVLVGWTVSVKVDESDMEEASGYDNQTDITEVSEHNSKNENNFGISNDVVSRPDFIIENPKEVISILDELNH
jgi:pyrophosphatase PpaX